MAEDSLRSAIDAIRSRLHEELETQLAQLTARHADEVESARRAAEADAEQRWSAKVEEVRGEWTARLESEVATVRAEAERRMVAESMRLRVEAEQAAAESAAAVREELERALADERAAPSSSSPPSAPPRRTARRRTFPRRRATRQRTHPSRDQLRARWRNTAPNGRVSKSRPPRSRPAPGARRRARPSRGEGAAHRARFEAHALERARVDEQLAEERSRAEEQTARAEARRGARRRTRRADDLDAQRQRADEAAREQRDRLPRSATSWCALSTPHGTSSTGLQGEFDRVKQTLEAAVRRSATGPSATTKPRRSTLSISPRKLSVEREKRQEDVRAARERDSALAEARIAERQSQLAVVERVLTALRSMDRASRCPTCSRR